MYLSFGLSANLAGWLADMPSAYRNIHTKNVLRRVTYPEGL
jgi:hypothetical protein